MHVSSSLTDHNMYTFSILDLRVGFSAQYSANRQCVVLLQFGKDSLEIDEGVFTQASHTAMSMT